MVWGERWIVLGRREIIRIFTSLVRGQRRGRDVAVIATGSYLL